jgi:hypothetical protein
VTTIERHQEHVRGTDDLALDGSPSRNSQNNAGKRYDAALLLCAEAHPLTGDLDRAAALFVESSTLAVAMSNTDSLVLNESGWRCWRWMAEAGRRRPSTGNAHSLPSMRIG